MYYKAIIECGHLGAGKSLDTVRYFRADNPVDLFSAAARIPRAKGKSLGTGVKLLEKITREEYKKGIEETRSSLYLLTSKNRPRNGRMVSVKAAKAMTQNYAPRQSSGQAVVARW